MDFKAPDRRFGLAGLSNFFGADAADRSFLGPGRVAEHIRCPQLVLSLFGTKPFDFSVARQIVGAVAILAIDHDTLAVVQRSPSGERAKRRLMVDLAEDDRAERRRHRNSLYRRNPLVGVDRPGLGQDCGCRLDGLIADD
jgi:hypothetical protein